MIRKRKKPNKSKSYAVKVTYDGIQFASKIERSMYRLLKAANIETNYEKEVFLLTEEFNSPNKCYERQMNGEGEFKDRSSTKISKMIYTPDFTGDDYIIEVKGWASPRFAVTWKLFKYHLLKQKDNRLLFKPQTLKDCTEVVELIKNQRLNEQEKRKPTKTK